MKHKLTWKICLTAALVVMLAALALILPTAGSEADTSLDIAYGNLSFENETHLLYAIESDAANVRLLVWNEDPQTSYTNGTQIATLEPIKRNYDINGVSHTVFKYTGLTAKQMTDVVYTRAYDPDTGEYGKLDKYSILQYAYNKLGKTGTATTNEALKGMLTSMLEYGANAQRYFGYKSHRLANENWVQITLTGGTLPDGFTQGLYLPGDTVMLSAPETNAEGDVFSHWADSDSKPVGYYTVLILSKNEDYIATYGDPIEYSEGLAFSNNSDGTCTVIGIGDCTDTELLIPPINSEGYRVTSIGWNAFGNCSNVTSVVIPLSITFIEDYAFSGCANLASIKVVEGNPYYHVDGNCLIETFSKRLISGCYNSVIPNDDSVTSIGRDAFRGREGLTSIVIPSNIEYLDFGAFEHCQNLESVIILEGVEYIEEAAFQGCYNLSEIVIPSTVNCINGQFVFAYCKLDSIIVTEGNPKYHSTGDCLIETETKTLISGSNNSIMPNDGSVTSIAEYAFLGRDSLEIIHISGSVESIGERAFSECSGLKSVILDDGVKSIGDTAFMDCFELSSIIIPDSVTNIERQAFWRCYSLQEITLPKSLTSIGEHAFYGTHLLNITFQGTTAEWQAIEKGNNWDEEIPPTYTIHCTDGTISKDGTVTPNP